MLGLNKIFAKRQDPTYRATLYFKIGEEQGTRALANRFYDIMLTAPEAAELLAIHPQPMDSIRERFFEFLSGWLGGPPLFEQKYGHPRLRARHLPFEVNQSMIDQWLFCMNKALEKEVKDLRARKAIKQAITPLAQHMLNC
ncbi:hemoglobin-like oxygen-binding protein [Saccharobesus litoralis]|uniref:Hemoglobin-like oxygen-binding protein n=1 Tax=Saccharobesus litoralis TaxID=2172099 RepID=A0A2S0VQJ4_9ALTE|nr:group II truncated hemoglobin [Saccharobesus litoralis]AWB66360.1 hemoglobin-like oxygen-binding protein [Saccharobesus litoralis]